MTIFWFRRDLRLHDNHALYRALQAGGPVLPIFIFDRNILDKLEDKSDRRVQFIFDTLTELNAKLRDYKSSIDIHHGTPEVVFKKLLSNYSIQQVYCNHDYEPDAIARDKKIEELLAQHGVTFHTYKDQVLFERNEILKSDGTPYTVFTPYSKIWKHALSELKGLPQYPSERELHRLHKNHSRQILPLEDIGFKKQDSIIPAPVISDDIIKHYEAQRNYPAVEGTTRLGVHLRFGTVSVRECISKAIGNEIWLNELIWREFFMMILYHFPHVVGSAFKSKYDQIPWRNKEEEFNLWCEGRTGYDMVDAGMRELNATGFMHNRVRMITASFLTKHLLIDWRWGEAYFASKLLDFELSANNGNWQWAAGCGCDAAPYFRIFNPMEQAKKFDENGDYRRKWLPGWPLMQEPPMVDHAKARLRALDVYKNALTP